MSGKGNKKKSNKSVSKVDSRGTGATAALSTLCICQFCDSAADADNEGVVECFNCRSWAHKKCAKLSDSMFELLQKSDDSIQFICDLCRNGQNEKRGKIEVHLENLTQLILKMSERIMKLEETHTGAGLDDRIEKMIEKKLAEALDERVEKEKRKLNLIVVNIPESRETDNVLKKKDEIERVKELFTKICPELEGMEVHDPVRLGEIRLGSKPRVLRVRVDNEEVKRQITKNAYRLNKGVNIEKKVFVNPDYTFAERKKNKTLRDELKVRIDGGQRDIGIRNGKIVTVKWAPTSDVDAQDKK